MSSIPPLGGSVGRSFAGIGARSAPAAAPAGSADKVAPQRAAAAGSQSGSAAEDLADYAFESAIDRARLLEWVERIRLLDRPSSWLVERPGPDVGRLAYPSAAQAYREMSAALAEL
jgi:hypothetical protein